MMTRVEKISSLEYPPIRPDGCRCFFCERFRADRERRRPLPAMQVQPEGNRLAGVTINNEGEAI